MKMQLQRAVLIFFAIIVAALIFPLFIGGDVLAQRLDNRTIMSRIDRMERDIMFLQRQLAQQGNGTNGYGSNSNSYGTAAISGGTGVNTARTQAAIDALAEELRKLRGQIEEQNYRHRQLQDRVERLATDLEYRLSQLERGGGNINTGNVDAGADTGDVIMDSTPPFAPSNAVDLSAPATSSPHPMAAGAGSSAGGLLRTPPSSPAGGSSSAAATATAGKAQLRSFSSPREHYNQAFRLLNQTRYEDSGRLFRSFIDKYPDSPLLGNAWYWLGESYYVRRNYVKAADSFRQGFEVLPDGPKASDNLLKLGMSLAALDRGSEACVVLRQLKKKYGGNSASIRQKAEQELNRIGCE